jgi:hypothetical protein
MRIKMQTINFLTELFVIGVFGIVWIDPLTKTLINYSIFDTLYVWNTSTILVLFAFTYFIGMFINFLSDIAFHLIDKLISQKYGGKEYLQKLRIKIIISSQEGANYLFRRRSIIRIFRANTFNVLVLLIIEAIFNVHIRYVNLLLVPRWSLLFSMSIILFTLLFAYLKTLSGYFAIIKICGEYINERQ